MPIWLRKFTFNNIQDFYTKEEEARKKAQSKNNKTTTSFNLGENNKVKVPDFVKNNPTYSSTISKRPKS